VECVIEFYWVIWEMVKFFEVDVLAIPEFGHDVAAFCVEINAKVALGFHMASESLTISLPFFYCGKHFFGYYGLV